MNAKLNVSYQSSPVHETLANLLANDAGTVGNLAGTAGMSYNDVKDGGT